MLINFKKLHQFSNRLYADDATFYTCLNVMSDWQLGSKMTYNLLLPEAMNGLLILTLTEQNGVYILL